MDFGPVKSLSILIRTHFRTLAVALFTTLLILGGLEFAFQSYQRQQEMQTLRGIESLLQDETTVSNSYTYSRRLRSLELLGVVVCSRFQEVEPTRRVYYDSTYLRECNPGEFRSSSISSMDRSRQWLAEVMIPAPPFLIWVHRTLVIMTLLIAAAGTWVVVRTEGFRAQAEQEKNWLKDLALQVRHDVASPLGALRIATQFPDLNPRLREFLELAVRRTGEIFEDLGRAREGGGSDAPKLFNGSETLRKIVEEKNTDRLSLSTQTFQVLGCESEFGRALSNLINNALEADSTADVQVLVNSHDLGFRIVIEDNGPGFPEEILAGPRKYLTIGKPGGSGLGIHYAASVLDKMGIDTVLQNTGSGARAELRSRTSKRYPVPISETPSPVTNATDSAHAE